MVDLILYSYVQIFVYINFSGDHAKSSSFAFIDYNLIVSHLYYGGFQGLIFMDDKIILKAKFVCIQ